MRLLFVSCVLVLSACGQQMTTPDAGDPLFICDTSAMVATTVNRSVSISDTATCAPGGSSHIWVMGTHGASRPGGSIHRELSATPEVSSF